MKNLFVVVSLMIISSCPIAGQIKERKQDSHMSKVHRFELYGREVSKGEFDTYIKKLELKPGAAKFIETSGGGESIYGVKNSDGQWIEVRMGTYEGKDYGAVVAHVDSAETLALIPLERLEISGDLRKRCLHLQSYGSEKLGAVGGGPVPSGEDYLTAIEIVKISDESQLKQLLRVNHPQMRANIVRALSVTKPELFKLSAFLKKDETRIRIQSMNDIPPIQDEETTVGDLVKKLEASLKLK